MTTYNTTTSGFNSGFSQPNLTGSTQTNRVTNSTPVPAPASVPTKTVSDAEIQQGFVNASTKERIRLTEWFVNIGVTEYLFTPEDGYDSVDGYFKFPGNPKKYVIEAKNRDIRTNQYQTHPFEETKWNALKYEYSRGYHPLFIIFTTDGAVLYNMKPRIEAGEGHNGLNFEVRGKYPQSTMGRSTTSCTRKVSEIRKDLEAFKDKVYTYQPKPTNPNQNPHPTL